MLRQSQPSLSTHRPSPRWCHAGLPGTVATMSQGPARSARNGSAPGGAVGAAECAVTASVSASSAAAGLLIAAIMAALLRHSSFRRRNVPRPLAQETIEHAAGVRALSAARDLPRGPLGDDAAAAIA